MRSAVSHWPLLVIVITPYAESERFESAATASMHTDRDAGREHGMRSQRRVHTFRPSRHRLAIMPASAPRPQPQPPSTQAQIVEGCDSLTWTTAGIFVVSLFLSILRPDPTLAVCLFGFYGALPSSRHLPPARTPAHHSVRCPRSFEGRDPLLLGLPAALCRGRRNVVV